MISMLSLVENTFQEESEMTYEMTYMPIYSGIIVLSLLFSARFNCFQTWWFSH